MSIQKVLIVEDHRDASEVLRSVVEATFADPEISMAGTVTAARKILLENRFDIALLDLGLPDGNGTELVKLIRATSPGTMSVVTTIFDDEEHLFEALRSGACGYLLKGHSPAELKSYLVDAVSGRPALSPKVAQAMLGFFREDFVPAGMGRDTGLKEELTSRETEVLSLIAKGCGVREVSELLEISANTVSHHIKNLYSKLNVHNRAEATAVAVQLNIFKPY